MSLQITLLSLTTYEFFALLFSIVVAISTVAYVILTSRLVKETRLMRKIQIEPQIVAYITATETHSSLIYIITKNIGQGVAYNVRFKIVKDLEYGFRKLSGYSYFSDGLNYFPPGKEDRHLIMSFGDENDNARVADSLILEVEYESILKDKKVDRYELRLKEIAGEANLNPPGTYIGMIGYRLEKIQKLLEKHQSFLEKQMKENNPK